MSHTLSDIRNEFIQFFEEKGHRQLPSSALVPHNDPTLMFTNAGMNQFKNIFTGLEAPLAPRAVSSQKCVRAGGKHNDLDNVGYTARHHTFFEMLGNFSFGDYFKEQAIEHAWELLHKRFGLAKDKLLVTVYHTDDEAFDLWRKISGLPESRIIRIEGADNFWAMGDTGPCGPCSEIFYDHGDHIEGGPPGSPNEDGDRFVEIWNLVFMQYDQQDIDTRVALPKPSIDTGMGLERITAVMQGKHNNYDIDLFQTLIKTSQALSKNDDAKMLASHRVIADHLRAASFLMADGVAPGNEGRAYVLRRIMRRAMRHAHMLGCKEPLMHQLVPGLVALMGAAYPELVRAEASITQSLKSEEERFKQTLDRGLKLLGDAKSTLKKGAIFPGDTAFKLYDTYGFPLDLTEDILRADQINVDKKAFDTAMSEQKQRARAAWSGSGEAKVADLWFRIHADTGNSEFLGYASDNAQATISALVKDGAQVEALNAGDEGYIITNQTPFYGESGGQVGDRGAIYQHTDLLAEITNTQKPVDGLIIHHVKVKKALKLGDVVDLKIDVAYRNAVRANHSATHLLHAAMRKHLGDHVNQKGSLVNADGLRFDISHQSAITRKELLAIEADVNQQIWQNSAVNTRIMTPDEAVKAGAVALFGEKYGDEVRVLSMGQSDDDSVYSIELCGGTHVANMGDIGLFKIISENSVAAGIRRIEALTRDRAFAYLTAQDNTIRDLARSLNKKPDSLNEAVNNLASEKRKLEKALANAKKQLAMAGDGGSSKGPDSEKIGDSVLVHQLFGELDAKSLRDIAMRYQKEHTDAVIMVASNYEGKANIIIALGKDAKPTSDAPSLVRLASDAVGGKGGGGKPNFAQAGGPNGDKLADALNAIKKALA
jgi:alanyl-tRNA synthetase